MTQNRSSDPAQYPTNPLAFGASFAAGHEGEAFHSSAGPPAASVAIDTAGTYYLVSRPCTLGAITLRSTGLAAGATGDVMTVSLSINGVTVRTFAFAFDDLIAPFDYLIQNFEPLIVEAGQRIGLVWTAGAITEIAAPGNTLGFVQ